MLQNQLQNTSKQAFPTGAAITSGAQAASGIFAQWMQNRANRKMAEYTYSKDLEMWERQNAYNSPEQQMQRFKDAGLNPNLIYGQGNAGNATTLPKYQKPDISIKAPQANVMGNLNMYQDLKNKKASEDVLQEQARLLSEKALTESVNRAYIFTKDQGAQFHLGMDRTYRGRERSAGIDYTQNRSATAWWNKQQQMQQYDITRKYGSQLANYNMQIAQQQLLMKIKDNQYYMHRLFGPYATSALRSVGGVAGRLLGGKFNMSKAAKGGIKLKGAKLPTKLTSAKPRKGFNYWNQANRAFSQYNNPY